MRKILLVTPTYQHQSRLAYIKRSLKVFCQVESLTWILCEDGASPDPEVNSLLTQSTIDFVYLSAGPTSEKGNLQRNVCYSYIRDNKLEGVVYNADDDNLYRPELFELLRKTKKVSIVSVGNLGPAGYEYPILKDGKVAAVSGDWPERKFPIDMSSFAFDASILQNLSEPLWGHSGVGGETEFLSRFLTSVADLEVLTDPKNVYVWHNYPL
jgi:beta-1,3-glucuronyltransferase P